MLSVPQAADLIASHADRVLPLSSARLSDEYLYQSLPLCVIDAVYSIGVRYVGVQRVIARYCEHFGLRKVRPDRHELPPTSEQEPISEFCTSVEHFGAERMANHVFRNRQRTSTQSGILKAEAVYQFASVLRAYRVEYLQDIPAVATNAAFEQDIRHIPGQRSGISLRYFWMLAGSDEFIKPDRMILRFLESVLGRSTSSSEAQVLLAAASERLEAKHPHITPRLLDYEIWKHQREQ